MTKRTILAVLAVFAAWTILDGLIHGVILTDSYQASQGLWRPHEQMNYWLIYLTTLVAATAFVLIYVLFFDRRTLGRALLYSLIYGLGAGIPMGYATYASMPVPYFLAFVWCWGTVAEYLAGGLILGLIIRDQPSV